MGFEAQQTGPVVTVRVGASLDFRTAAAFKEFVGALLARGARHFVLDFSRTGILDSTGLGAMFSLQRKLGGYPSSSVAMAAPTRPVRAVCGLARIHKVFKVYPSVGEAERAILEAGQG